MIKHINMNPTNQQTDSSKPIPTAQLETGHWGDGFTDVRGYIQGPN